MTDRQEFVKAAMQSLISNQNTNMLTYCSKSMAEKIALNACAIADAAIEAECQTRKKGDAGFDYVPNSKHPDTV